MAHLFCTPVALLASQRVFCTHTGAPPHALVIQCPYECVVLLLTSLVTYRSIKSQMQTLTDAWQWQEDDRLLHTMPLHHIHGLVNGLLCAHYASATVQFAPFNAPHVWRSLTQGEASVFMGVPTMYSHLIRVYDKMSGEQQAACRAAAAELRLTVCGSSACPATVLKDWQALAGSVRTSTLSC